MHKNLAAVFCVYVLIFCNSNPYTILIYVKYIVSVYAFVRKRAFEFVELL